MQLRERDASLGTMADRYQRLKTVEIVPFRGPSSFRVESNNHNG